MKIAIAGYGLEGEANYQYWNTPDNELTIVDEHQPGRELPEGAKTLIGEGVFGKLDGFDLVVRTAGLSPYKITTDSKVWSATNEFFAKCPAPIIGVTGTKGKGTTASLIASILQAAGKTVHLVGNIGTPALSVLPQILPEDIVVYELSSFQLWDIEKSPHVAVVLMIEPDHLDVHENLEDYLKAKMNIVRYQNEHDVAIYTLDSIYNDLTDVARIVEPRAIPVPDDHYIHVADGKFYCYTQEICSVQSLRLPGEHNIQNACAAIAAAWQYTQDSKAIRSGLSSFEGLEHRLKYVQEINGVRFYDDSIATTPGSAVAAIRSIEGPKVIIIGGVDKGGDYNEVISTAATTNTTIIGIGAMKDYIANLCRQHGVSYIVGKEDMDGIVEQAFAYAYPRSATVILSPAAASFDMFKNYKDRGEQFIAAVDRLTASKSDG